MLGFNWLKRGPAAPAQRSDTGVLDLGTRLDGIEKQLREVQLMRLEWAEVLDKLTAWTNRQSARDAKYLKVGLAKIAQDAPEPTNDEEAEESPTLTKADLRRRLRAQNGGIR